MTKNMPRHFLDLDLLEPAILRQILDMGRAMKQGDFAVAAPLSGKTLAMIFEKPSTRTRVSFEVGMYQLGGNAVILGSDESQLGRGETVADTARVLSRYVDAIMIRTDDPQKMHDLAANADIPVINGLTDASHPCQVMADVMTFEEHRGSIAGKSVAWSGDGNNMAASWIHAAVRFEFSLRLACPEKLSPPQALMDWARTQGGDVSLTDKAQDAVGGADLVVTDTWVSMGDKDGESRRKLLEPYRVDTDLMSGAKKDALFMHCLPAHRGEEVSDEVIDGPFSVVWDEAENRLHVQKAILAWCCSVSGDESDDDALDDLS
jgi:ornithine carbamoyltransferase